jgi:two-component system, cell cycle sensor histidine kinase and response regulator CckA
MSQTSRDAQYRLLIIDDNPAIHEDFRKILGAPTSAAERLDDVEAALFGEAAATPGRAEFRIDSAHQGKEALALVQQAVAAGDPYALAFVDVRMPPGWDGIETLEHIWKVAPELQAVICTAYSDYSWDDITRRFGSIDNLLILKKPFETVEVLQLAHALTKKWTLTGQAKLRLEDLERMVHQRTEELVAANHQLGGEVEERARIEEALRLSEERFSKAFQASPFPMAILRSQDLRFLDANQSFLELSGHDYEQLLASTGNELRLWGEPAGESGLPPITGERIRNEPRVFHRSDGVQRQTLVCVEPIQIGHIACLLLVVEDITDQLKLETQLRQAQKMEVIGRMAAGIAHEFNNILTVIQGDVGLLQTSPAHTEDDRALLDQIMQASRRAATLTSQMLAFSRKQVLQPRQLQLPTLVQRMRTMLGRLIGENYQIDLQCDTELPHILADEGGIEQVLINLVLNARDALGDGGRIEIRTGIETVEDPAARDNPDARPGQFACLTVADQGCGMNPHVMARIFDPFFTTKEVGKGTGLGLSMIHGIVKQHEGWIEVASEPNRGSTFKILLPLAEPLPMPATTRTETIAPAEPGRGETIMVVEDETAVRELAAAALRKRGYEVLRASDGPEALRVWDRHNAPVDLVLTDMVMPSGMSGGELARALQARNPALKIIYTSGYSPEIMREDSLTAKTVNFLPKPYDLQTLLKAVRHCLDGGTLEWDHLRPDQADETAFVG